MSSNHLNQNAFIELAEIMWGIELANCERDLGCQVATLSIARKEFLQWHLMCQSMDCQYV